MDYEQFWKMSALFMGKTPRNMHLNQIRTRKKLQIITYYLQKRIHPGYKFHNYFSLAQACVNPCMNHT